MRGIIISLTILILLNACSYEEPTTDVVKEESPAAVQFDVVGSQIEGLTVCYEGNSTCKKTDSKGHVEFSLFGRYKFMIREMHLNTLTIDSNRTIISPYALFENNDTMAQRYLMLVHAFSKSSDPTDESVLLTLSDYIPTDTNISALLAKTEVNATTQHHVLKYTINDHNISLDFNDTNISRDGTDFNLSIPSKAGYLALESVKNFVDLAVDKNVSLDNFEEKFLLSKTSLLSFTLGSKYTVNMKVEGDDVKVSFLDNESRVTDVSTLIDNNNSAVLSTNLISLRIREVDN